MREKINSLPFWLLLGEDAEGLIIGFVRFD